MNTFLRAAGTILLGVIILVVADQITGAMERARVRRLAAKAQANKDTDTGNGTA